MRTLITQQTLGPIYSKMTGKPRSPDSWAQKTRLCKGLDQAIFQCTR